MGEGWTGTMTIANARAQMPGDGFGYGTPIDDQTQFLQLIQNPCFPMRFCRVRRLIQSHR